MVPRFKIAYSKVSKRFTAKKVKTEKSYNFLRVIIKDSYDRACTKQKDKQKRKRRLFVTPTERPERNNIIEQSTKYSRL